MDDKPQGPSARRRRDKPQLSCIDCRRRKSRCDRKQPCSNCNARDQPCVYAEAPEGGGRRDAPPSHASVTDLHDRLAHLESLIMSFKSEPATSQTSSHNAPPSAPDPSDTPTDGLSECGSMQISATEQRYLGSDHWASIVDSISDLREHVDRVEQMGLMTPVEEAPDEDEGDADKRTHRSLLLYGCSPGTRPDILAALPPRAAVDRYVSRYFNRMDLASTCFHGPSFLKEYEAFWSSPNTTPIIWVGLLFSMINLALITSEADTDTSHDQQVDLYREKTVQCLFMGEYTKPGPYVLETIIQYVYVEFLLSPDADHDLWLLLSLEVNTALRMGYHRDPSHFAHIDAFQGEMRRRVWSTVRLGDILISSQMGMPRMMAEWKCDTAEPRNLNDTDMAPGMAQLPSSRPETEYTTATGTIARGRLLKVLGTISDLISSTRRIGYDEVMRVDRALHEAAASLPAPCQMKPIAASITDTPQAIMGRIFSSHIYYRGQLILHHRFLHLRPPDESQDPFAYSRNACLEASLGSLQLQKTLDEETRPGGQLDTMRWRVTSITNHQFLTATMILCSLLHRGQTLGQGDAIVAALRGARSIWIRKCAVSREAQRATEAISYVLAKVGESNEPLGDAAPESNVGLDSLGMTADLDMDFSTVPGNMLPPFWGAFSTSPNLQETATPDMDMGRIGASGQALDDWMALNWPHAT